MSFKSYRQLSRTSFTLFPARAADCRRFYYSVTPTQLSAPMHRALKGKAKKYFLTQKVRQGQRQKNLLMKTLDFSDPATSEKFRHLSLMTATGHFEAAKDESARENPIVPILLTVSDPPRNVAAATPHNNDASGNSFCRLFAQRML